MPTPRCAQSPSRLATLLLIALLIAGCAEGNPNVAATVNGVQISVDQVNKGVDEALRSPQVPQQLKTDPDAKKSLQAQVLDRMIQTVLMEQAAKDVGVAVTDQEVQARLAEVVTQVGGRESYEQLLKEGGLTEASVLTEVRSAILGEKLKQKLDDRIDVSDQDVRSAYADAASARHILLRTQEEAQRVKDRITGGEDFGAIAKELSTDETTKESGGDLGLVKRGQTVPEFERALFAANQSDVVGPVQTQFGFHVIQRLPIPPFEDVQGKLRDELLQQRQGQAFSDFLNQQRAKATIQVNPRFGVWDPASGVRSSEPLGGLRSEPQAPGE